VWQETFTFRLVRPEVAILYVAVHDQHEYAIGGVALAFGGGSGGGGGGSGVPESTLPVPSLRSGASSFLAYFAVPVAAIRWGYRACPLRNAQGKKLPLCSLLCHFERV